MEFTEDQLKGNAFKNTLRAAIFKTGYDLNSVIIIRSKITEVTSLHINKVRIII